ncbi:MAG: hypothetical protein ABIG68_05535 [Acidobacteriota bacterium]
MLRYSMSALMALILVLPLASAQVSPFKNFSQFSGGVPGLDFFASSAQQVAPFEKPMLEARKKLADLLGTEPPKGAVFICSTLEQKDAVYEPRAIKLGYSWVLLVLTAEARQQEMMARMKAQMGGEIPPEVLERMRNRPAGGRGGEETGMARVAIRQMAYAVVQAMFAPDKAFRVSRLEDMARSPLADWVDIGIAGYVAGAPNVDFLQQRIEEAFPLDDILGMSRPYVAPAEGGSSGGGGGLVIRMEGAPGGSAQSGAQPGSGGAGRGGPPRQLPKDVQDRMMFDAQASTFFTFLCERAGLQKARDLIQLSREGKETKPFITRTDVLGADFDKIEADWVAWVKSQQPERPTEIRIRATPGEPPPPLR